MIYYSADPLVYDFQDTTASLSNDLASKGKLKRLDVDFSKELPSKINAETTLMIYDTLFKVLRHELWKDIQKAKSRKGVQELPEDDFGELYAGIHSRFDALRVTVFEHVIGETLPDKAFAREFTQKAYCTFGESEVHGVSLVQAVQNVSQ